MLSHLAIEVVFSGFDGRADDLRTRSLVAVVFGSEIPWVLCCRVVVCVCPGVVSLGEYVALVV